jgi:hypothetical protein
VKPEAKPKTGRDLRTSSGVDCLLFAEPGPQNTAATLARAAKRAAELGPVRVLVASSSGETGVAALRHFPGPDLVVVTHSTGFAKPNDQELKPPNRRLLEQAGASILTAQHAFGGVGRAVRKKLGTYEIDEVIAFALRTFGQGAKVAIEIALMAADAGLVRVGEPCLSIGGTDRGADTALLLRPANAQTFFDLRVMEILAKPRL